MPRTLRQPFRQIGERPNRSPSREDYLSLFFFASLFFLCGADQYFATRLLGFNLRWGQLLFLGALVAALRNLQTSSDSGAEGNLLLWDILRAWIPFAAFYTLAALFSSTPSLSLLKLGWAAFNIGGAILICLNPSWPKLLQEGFRWGILCIAFFILLQSLALYWFHLPVEGVQYPSTPLFLHLSGMTIPFGFAQPGSGLEYKGTLMFRPNAFYYEPSYAGCALAFSFPLLFAFEMNRKISRGWVPAVVLTSIFLVGSRSGILGALSIVALMVVATFLKHFKEWRLLIFKTLGTTFLLLALLCVSPGIRDFMGFLWSPLGPQKILSRIDNIKSPEGGRLNNVKQSWESWENHFWLGNGVETNSQTGGLKPVTANTWFEIIRESGLFGLLAFIFALFSSMRKALSLCPSPAFVWFIGAAWTIHLLVNLNFSQTFPRLDYWLLFYFSICLLANPYPKET